MKRMRGAFVLALVLAMSAGCLRDKDNNGPGPDGVTQDTSGQDWTGGDVTYTPPDWVPFDAPEKNAIVGQVVDPAGNAISGVQVQGAGKTASTNYEGFYALEELAPSDTIVVKFTHPSFAAITKTGTMFQDGRATVNAVMVPRAPAKSVDPSAASDLAFASGTVSVPAGAVVDAAGAPVTKPVMLRMTPVDVSGKGVLAAPGDFSAVREDDSQSQLETFAMAEFAVVDEAGQELKIKEGEKVTVEMLLPADTNLTEGEEVPAWHFDDTTGKWVEEGKGVVQKYSKDPSRLSYLVEVGHFSWWNCDKPMETTCVSGKVLQCDGTPASGADLMIDSEEYDGTSSGFGGGDGSFCIPARTNSAVRVIAAYGVGQNRVAKAVTVTTGSDPSSCPGPCTAADITLPCTPEESDLDCGDAYFVGCKGCLKGKVVNEDGSPVPYAAVEVKTGNTQYKRLADAQGNYCTPSALNTVTTLQARGGGASAGMITFTATQAGACPACEEVPNIVVRKEQDGDIIATTTCVTDVGGVTLEQVVGNGVPPALLGLDGAWGHISRTENPDNGDVRWYLDLYFVSSASNGALYGFPYAHLQFFLEETVTGPKVYPLHYIEGDQGYSFGAEASTAVGDIVGLGNATYRLTDSSMGWDDVTQYGSVEFTSAVGDVGTRATGQFQIRFQPECGPVGSELMLKGTFDLPVSKSGFDLIGTTGDVDYLVYLQCSLISLYAWASNLEQIFMGAVQLELDGVALAATDGELFGQAKYSVKDDQLFVSMYADETISITVDGPTLGDNPVTSANLYTSNCYYTAGTGTVTLVDFGDPSITTWWTGSLVVDYPEGTASEEGASCPPHTVTGQFGAAVCVQ